MKILYIAGAGRSGSTLLDMALGQAPAVCSCGELSNLSTVARDGLLCSCGAPVRDCPFWSQVLARTGTFDPAEETVLNHSRRISSWLKVLGGSQQKRYVEWVDSVYQAIGEISGSGTVVDSSKSPLRLAALLRHSSHDVYVIHLVRDPGKVAASLAKPLKQDVAAGVQTDLGRKQHLRTYAFWTAINFLVHLAASGSGRRYVRVGYEDFTRDPSGQINRILDLADCGPGRPLENQPLAGGHLMAGNRLRLKKDVVIREDASAAPAEASSALGRFISWPLRGLYGYGR